MKLIVKMAPEEQQHDTQLKTRKRLQVLIESGIKSNQQLIKMCSTSLATIKRVKKALKENRGVERKPGGGRPFKLKTNDKRRIAKLVVKNPLLSATRIAQKAHKLGSPNLTSIRLKMSGD